MKVAREKEGVKRAKEIIGEVAEEGEGTVEQIEKVHRIRKFDKNGTRPIKIRFVTQMVAEPVLQGLETLAKVEGIRQYG